jgi:tRNA dimethylallyltransferase
MNNVEHSLYGYVDGGKRYNVEKWCKDASKVIEESFEKNTTPILVGGTGLYINTLINGIINIPSIPEEIKIESEKILTKFGKDFLINQIKNIDPDSLNEININDNVRLRRIWEVFETTGKKFSEWKLNENKSFIKNYNFKLILFLPDRKKNYEIVNSRFIKMINRGAIEEVKNLLGENLNESLPVMRAHGVPEIKKYLENETTLEECIVKGQQVTRNYVKRQHTWWNSSKLEIFHKFDKFPDEIDINAVKFE